MYWVASSITGLSDGVLRLPIAQNVPISEENYGL